MWRTQAVISMLMEDVAGLPASPHGTGDTTDDTEILETERLEKAGRRAKLAVAVDLLAIMILFLFRDSTRPFLPLNQTLETVFTFGVLAVAAHAGFRLAQVENLRAVRQLCHDLRDRQGS